MTKASKGISGFTFLLMIIAGLLCSVPSYAEESEKTEQVEETIILVSKKQQQEIIDDTPGTSSTRKIIPVSSPAPSSQAHKPFNRLFILYQSLRLLD